MKLIEAISERKSKRAELSKLSRELTVAQKTYTWRPNEDAPVPLDEVTPMLEKFKALVKEIPELDTKIDKANCLSGNHERINKIHILKQYATTLDSLIVGCDKHRTIWKDIVVYSDGKMIPQRVKETTELIIDPAKLKAELADVENQLRQLYIAIDSANYTTEVE